MFQLAMVSLFKKKRSDAPKTTLTEEEIAHLTTYTKLTREQVGAVACMVVLFIMAPWVSEGDASLVCNRFCLLFPNEESRLYSCINALLYISVPHLF